MNRVSVRGVLVLTTVAAVASVAVAAAPAAAATPVVTPSATDDLVIKRPAGPVRPGMGDPSCGGCW